MAADETALSQIQLTEVYAAIEQTYRGQGKFRDDITPIDAPFDATTLTQNFAHVALRSEKQSVGDVTLVEERPSPLTRWESPLQLWTIGTTDADHDHIDNLSLRIAKLSGLPISRTRDAQSANVYVLVANAEERRDLKGLISTLGYQNDGPLGEAWPEEVKFPCIARVAINPVTSTIQWAIILIKDELKGAFRRSCFTEELVQSLGLFNDGADIRPSIFNDDAEFIELTRHDEYLLKILYDRRLRPGMTRGMAVPLVREIAAELLAAKTY